MIEIDISKNLHGTQKNMQLQVKLEIQNGDFLALSGKSGSGKTTLLRVLAGLESADGVIKVDGKLWHDKHFVLPPQKREIGFVFQEYALFSNMSVLENLLFVNKAKNLANKLLDITELTTLKNRRPLSLSGGQKQRVSLCRALMSQPKLLLMDEPLSALDIDMREKLQSEIKVLHDEFQTTTIMVSHDKSEIYRLSDKVITLEQGKIINESCTKDMIVQNIKEHLLLEGKLIEIQTDKDSYFAIIMVENQFTKIEITQKYAKELNVGKILTISTNQLML